MVLRGMLDGAMTHSRIVVCGLVGSVTFALCLAGAGVASAADWQTQPLPAVQNGSLTGVSCTSATACSAVGEIGIANGYQAILAESRDGATWSAQPAPNIPGAPTSTLDTVSCTSPNACTAVGYYSTNVYHSAGGTLAERWNGVSWTIQPTPNPAHAATSYLPGVSCTSPTACVAVGYSIESPQAPGQFVTLVERWNGVDWSIQPAPSPMAYVGAGSLLGSVSCTSATACTAVGWSHNKSGYEVPLAEHWNGVSWSVEPTPGVLGVLFGVSCASPRTCTAVGVRGGETAKTLAERWNGVSWSTQATPNPAGRQGALFNAVSCPSTTVCTAVGSSTDNTGGTYTLAERRHGNSWSIQTTAGPQAFADFYGVSCPSISKCTAVGFDSQGALAEHYQASTG